MKIEHEIIQKDLEKKVGLLIKHSILEEVRVKLTERAGKIAQRTFDFQEELEKLRKDFCERYEKIPQINDMYHDISEKLPNMFCNITEHTISELKEYWKTNEKNCSICDYMFRFPDGKNIPLEILADHNQWCGSHPDFSGIHDPKAIKQCVSFKEYISVPEIPEQEKLDIFENKSGPINFDFYYFHYHLK